MSRVISAGLKASIATITSVPAPASLIEPVAFPGGALLQSTLTHKRWSGPALPVAALSTIHGALAAAVKSNGAFPLLNTSINWR